MVNFSQEDDEKSLGQETPENQAIGTIREGADIEFDELVDIDEIQKKLREHMADFGDSSDENNDGVLAESTPEESALGETTEKIVAPIMPIAKKPAAPIDPDSKKYVLYIDPDNVDFMESLSIEDRKVIVNRILKEQTEEARKKKIAKEKEKFFVNAVIVTITVIVFFPIMFFAVNKAMEISITNYKNTKENFVRLYKAKGKIKPANDSAPDDYNY